jgi:hypothetical protein
MAKRIANGSALEIPGIARLIPILSDLVLIRVNPCPSVAFAITFANWKNLTYATKNQVG